MEIGSEERKTGRSPKPPRGHNVGCKSSIEGALQKCWSVEACYTSPKALASGGSQRWPRIKSDSRPASNKVV
jgi:hypothetical protein